MAFYEVEPFLQIDNNHVRDIYKENSVTFISIFMIKSSLIEGHFDCSPVRVGQATVKMLKVEPQCLVASGASYHSWVSKFQTPETSSLSSDFETCNHLIRYQLIT